MQIIGYPGSSAGSSAILCNVLLNNDGGSHTVKLNQITLHKYGVDVTFEVANCEYSPWCLKLCWKFLDVV